MGNNIRGQTFKEEYEERLRRFCSSCNRWSFNNWCERCFPERNREVLG